MAVLSILLVATGIAYFAYSSGAVVLAAIVLLAALAVAWTLHLQRSVARKTSRLDAASRDDYEYVRQAVSAAPLSSKEKRELQDEVLDLFLSAQAEGRSSGDVTGNDRAAFAARILAAYGVGKRQPWTWALDSLMYFIGYAAGVQGLLALEEPSRTSGFFAAAADHSILVFFALLSVALPFCQLLARRIKASRKGGAMLFLPFLVLPVGIGGLFIAFMEIVRAMPVRASAVIAFMDGRTAVFPSPIALSLGLALFAGAWLLKASLSRRKPTIE